MVVERDTTTRSERDGDAYVVATHTGRERSNKQRMPRAQAKETPKKI